MFKNFKKFVFEFFLPKAEQEANKVNLRNAIDKVLKYIDGHTNPGKITEAEKIALKKYVFDDDMKNINSKLEKNNDNRWDKTKSIVQNFFGMNDNWSFWRNIGGGLMVHGPEYPTYFIPAYTQAKATGEASDLKKGEGPRGLITGGLEGVAVGALVSGGKIRWRTEMGPYILLGAGLQYFSSKFFPWLGEKMGREVYFRNMEKKGLIISKEQLKELKALKAKSEKHGKVKTAKGVKKPNENNTTINPKPAYAYPKSGGMKI